MYFYLLEIKTIIIIIIVIVGYRYRYRYRRQSRPRAQVPFGQHQDTELWNNQQSRSQSPRVICF